MGEDGDFRVINLRHKRLTRKYKAIFDFYYKILALFQKKKPNTKKVRHQVHKPLSK